MNVAEIDAEIAELQRKYDAVFAQWRDASSNISLPEARSYFSAVAALERRLDSLRADRIAIISGIVIEPAMSQSRQVPLVIEKAGPRIADLEARIDQLEARPTPRYVGVWKAGETYEEGSFVTCSGSLWHANRSTDHRPGTSDDWQLSVKKDRPGRNAKEARS
jgi:hypothetical protein